MGPEDVAACGPRCLWLARFPLPVLWRVRAFPALAMHRFVAGLRPSWRGGSLRLNILGPPVLLNHLLKQRP